VGAGEAADPLLRLLDESTKGGVADPCIKERK
jgi:hypothetical protein